MVTFPTRGQAQNWPEGNWLAAFRVPHRPGDLGKWRSCTNISRLFSEIINTNNHTETYDCALFLMIYGALPVPGDYLGPLSVCRIHGPHATYMYMFLASPHQVAEYIAVANYSSDIEFLGCGLNPLSLRSAAIGQRPNYNPSGIMPNQFVPWSKRRKRM